MKNSWFKKTFIGLIPLLLLLSLAPSAMAFDGRGGDKVTVETGEVIEGDFYAGGNDVVVNGTIKGDLIAGGNKVEINGRVEGDVLAGGSLIVINGTVTDDVRAGGAAVVVGEKGKIGGDLISFGQSIELKKGSTIEGDLFGAGGQLVLNGTINGKVQVATGAMALDGTINGNVDAQVGGGDAQSVNVFETMSQFNPNMPKIDFPEVAPGLTLGSNAKIKGDFKYESVNQSAVSPNQVSGKVTFNQQQVTEEKKPSTTQLLLGQLWGAVQQWVVLFLVGLFLLWLLPYLLKSSADAVGNRPIPSLLFGLLVMIFLPIVLVVAFALLILFAVLLGAVKLGALAATVIGIGLVLLFGLLLIYIAVWVFLAKITVGYWLGRLVFRNGGWAALALGLLVMVLLVAIPFSIGSILNLVITLFGLGAILLVSRGKTNKSIVFEKPISA